MPSIVSHPAVALGLAPWYRALARRPGVIAVGVLLTILPDADVIGFSFGIAYGDMLGHRGLTHSIPFAIVVSAAVAGLTAWRTRLSWWLLWSYFALCTVSHGLFDALTNGGRGIALWAPFSNARFFFPWQPIAVSPIGIERFLSPRGAQVLMSELAWVWLPCLLLGLVGVCLRRLRARRLSSVTEHRQ